MDPFKEREVEDPAGFGEIADKPLFNAGAVKMPENRQQGIVIVPIPVPNDLHIISQVVRVHIFKVLLLGIKIFFLLSGIF